MILLDTNILVYALNEDAVQHRACFKLLEAAVNGQFPAVLVPQVLLECYSVVTSARRLPNPLRPRQILSEMRIWRTSIPTLEVRVEALEELEHLAGSTQRAGAEVYDLFLIAQMRTHKVREICTVNLRHFQILGIRAHLPEQTLARYGRT